MATATSYKRLGFVESYANYFVNSAGYLEKVYQGAKGYVPASVKPYVTKVEDVVVANTAPAVAKAQDIGGKLLHTADDQVDVVLNKYNELLNNGKSAVSSSLSSAKSLHEENVHNYYASMKSYFDAVVKQGDWVADKLSPIKTVQNAREALHAAVTKAWDISDPDKAVESVHQAWQKFAAVPAVASLLNSTEPITQRGVSFLTASHDWLVANPLYKKTVDTSYASLRWYLDTAPARLAKTYLYPVVAPIADPTYERLSKSQTIQKTLDYWKPSAVAA